MAKSKKHDLPPIQITAAGRNAEEQQRNLNVVAPSPGYPTAVHLLCDAIEKRSDTTVLDFTPQIVNIQYRIDGMWHKMPPMDRETGDFMMASLKQLAGMNYRERRARQEGGFQVMLMKRRYKVRLLSQGIKTGERIAMYLNIPEPSIETLTEMGINPKVLAALEEKLASDTGMILVSAMPGEGYTATWRATLGACDRYVRDYYVLEEKSRVEPEVINIKSVTYDESQGQTAFTPMPNILLQQPNVLAFTEPTNGDVINKMLGLAEKEYLVLTRIHGKHCIDALLRLVAHKPDLNRLAQQLHVVICMRIVRKLCRECRVAYTPHPKLLQQLAIPPGRIRQFYKPFVFEPGMLDENQREIDPCPNCSGIGYYERTGIFEVLHVNDEFRQVLARNPRMDTLHAVAKKHRHVNMRDMGVLAVASGITSLEEIQRVLNK